MRCVNRTEAPFSLDDLASRIRRSSNFHFAWDFYFVDGFDLRSPNAIRTIVEQIIGDRELHMFLHDSFDAMYDQTFEIGPLEKNCRVVSASGEFEDVLARAAADVLGAYSRRLRESTDAERREIKDLFGSLGDHVTFQLQGDGLYDHTFSTWFYCVAWDWCLIAAWPRKKMLWLGCLSDTD